LTSKHGDQCIRVPPVRHIVKPWVTAGIAQGDFFMCSSQEFVHVPP
jgi:hypothetical protein